MEGIFLPEEILTLILTYISSPYFRRYIFSLTGEFVKNVQNFHDQRDLNLQHNLENNNLFQEKLVLIFRQNIHFS